MEGWRHTGLEGPWSTWPNWSWLHRCLETESAQVWTQRGIGMRAMGLGPGSLLAPPP